MTTIFLLVRVHVTNRIVVVATEVGLEDGLPVGVCVDAAAVEASLQPVHLLIDKVGARGTRTGARMLVESLSVLVASRRVQHVVAYLMWQLARRVHCQADHAEHEQQYEEQEQHEGVEEQRNLIAIGAQYPQAQERRDQHERAERDKNARH